MKRNLYYLLLFALLLSACSGARYGHYGYVKKNDRVIAKEKRDRKKQVSLNQTDNITEPVVNTKQEPIVEDSLLALSYANNEVKQVHQVAQNKSKTVQKNIVTKQKYKETLEPKRETKHKVDEKPRPNDMANTALLLSIFAVILFIASPFIGFIAFLGGLALGLSAFVVAILALSDINKKPEAYTNRAAAIFALVVGALSVVAILSLTVLLAYFIIVLL